MTRKSLPGRLGRAVLPPLLAGAALLALGGQAAADAHVDPDACLDLSQTDFWRGDQQYHWVEAPGPSADGCPLWVAVPY